jgi:hypothetical protein
MQEQHKPEVKVGVSVLVKKGDRILSKDTILARSIIANSIVPVSEEKR